MDVQKLKSCKWCGVVFVAVILTMVTAAGAQSAPPGPPPFGGGPGLAGGMMGGEFGEGKSVTGAPLSGTVIVTRDTTLADGNTIHNESQAKVYRDSQGRVRRELGVDLATPATGKVKRNLVVIVDAAAGKRYVLNPDNKTAREMPAHGARAHSIHGTDGPGSGDAGSGPAGPGGPGVVTKEQLGTKTINGVQAEGVRVTRTIAAGAIGNDKPILVVTERWYSPDLQMAVLTVHTDPMVGTVTTKLVNVTRGEPDASLFQVPADYAVEAGKPGDPMYVPMKP